MPDDILKSKLASPTGLSIRKPTWWNACGRVATSAFFVHSAMLWLVALKHLCLINYFQTPP
jgi:hypothetical protein